MKVGQRKDLSEVQLRELLKGTVDGVRRRLFEAVEPARKNAIRQAMQEISEVPVRSRRDFAPAQRTVMALHRAGELNEGALLSFAKSLKYEETVAALAAMSGVKIVTLDRLIGSDRHDPLLIIGKALELEWVTVRALIMLRLGQNRVPSMADIEAARVNYTRLMPTAAERVVAFWQTSEA
jgi:hypothetical protein